jgi:3-methyladenine DNA glycosylase AlkD
MMTAQEIRKRLRSLADPEKAKVLQRFFKTGPGEYGEGDRFLGIVVPAIRKQVRELHDTPLPEVKKLLRSSVHEERLLALLLFVKKYEKGDDALKEKIYGLYLNSTKHINNWDLVDLTAEKIVGPHLRNGARGPLYRLARSKSLWERRIALLSTFHFIKNHEFAETLRIARMLLQDGEDLIHKAVGWMLREVGKRDVAALEGFLRKHYRAMPRTMLRYAIERFPEAKRKRYLNGKM